VEGLTSAKQSLGEGNGGADYHQFVTASYEKIMLCAVCALFWGAQNRAQLICGNEPHNRADLSGLSFQAAVDLDQ
jgi:hypothetical protein